MYHFLTDSFQRATKTDKSLVVYAGSDMSALIAANRIVDGFIRQRRHSVILQFPTHVPSNKPEAQLPVAQDFFFYERHLLNKVVRPFFKELKPYADSEVSEQICYTPEHLKILYGSSLQIEENTNVNDQDAVKKIIDDPKIIGGLSVRCYQKFLPPTIDSYAEKSKFLWNLHPGMLPEYRGIFSPVWALAKNQTYFNWSLHQIDEEFDRGPLIDISDEHYFDSDTNALGLYYKTARGAAKTVLKNIDKLLRYNHRDHICLEHQDEARAPTRPFSFPKREDYAAWNERRISIKYLDPEEIIGFYADAFMPPGHPERARFEKALRSASISWLDSKEKLNHGSRPTQMVYPKDFEHDITTITFSRSALEGPPPP